MTNEISRELLGKIVDEVFDGGLEDASVIEDIYRVIKREEDLSTPDDGWRTLESARSEADEIRKYALEATKTLTCLAGGGSEMFGREIDGMFTADLELCATRILERFDRAHRLLLRESALRRAAEDKLAISPLPAPPANDGRGE